MKIKKNLVAATAAVLAAGMALAGCGSSNGGSGDVQKTADGKVKITMWHGFSEADGKTLESIGFAGAKDWAASAKTDKEFGGDKLAENLGIAKQARDQFATPELRKLLETSPLGNNPEVIRLFYRIGKAISSDTYVPGGKAAPSASTAQRLYGASKMNP